MLCVTKVRNYMLMFSIASLSILTGFKSNAGEWKETGQGWGYVEEDGNFVFNKRILDHKGDIYYIDSTGNMLSNTSDPLNNYFTDSGVWLNPNAINVAKNKEEFSKLLSDGEANFNNLDEAVGFLNYIVYVKLVDFPGATIMNSDKGKTYISLNSNTRLKDSLAKLSSIDMQLNELAFGCRGGDDVATINAVVNVVLSSYIYAEGNKDIYTGLQTGKGQCSAYAQLFANLCDRLGYEVEMIGCDMLSVGQKHAINRVKLNNTWHYYDLTSADNHNKEVRTEFIDMNLATINKYYLWTSASSYGLGR